MNTETSVNLNTITFDGLIENIELGASIDKPVIILGTFGIGKSAGVNLAAAKLGYTVVDYRASEVLPEDIGGIGVPMTQGDADMYVQRAVPDIIQACRAAHISTGMPVLLFLDEITSALPAVQAALFQVFLDRKAGGQALPQGTYVVAAGNLASDRSVVEELARPLLNRAMVYNFIGPTLEEYKRLMSVEEFHPVVQTFLEVHPQYVCDKINPDNEQSPTPRSLETASDLLKSPKLRNRNRMTALAATLGGECASAIEAFLTINDGLVPFPSIMDDPEGVQMPSGEDFAVGYMQMLGAAQGLNRKMSEDAKANAPLVDKLWVYIKRVPVELGTLLITSLKSPAVTVLLTNHLAELESAEDGAYGRILTQLV